MSKQQTEAIPSSEELNPLSGTTVEAELKNAYQKILVTAKDADWNVIYDHITILRRIFVHHHTEVIPVLNTNSVVKLKPLLLAILEQVDNLRSMVSRNAISCIGDMFSALGKALDGELEVVMPRLFKKYGESSKFYEGDTDKALSQVIANTTASKALSPLLLNVSNKNPVIRGKVSAFIARLVTARLGAQVLKLKELPKLFQSITQLAVDANSEARIKAKQTVYALYNYYPSESDFEKSLVKYSLNSTEIRSIREIVEKAKREKTIEDVSEHSSPVFSAHQQHQQQGQTPTSSQPTTPVPSPAKKTVAKTATPAKPLVLTPKDASATKKTTFAEEDVIEEEDDVVSNDSSESQFRGLQRVSVVLGGDMEENITVCVRIRPLDSNERSKNRELWQVDSNNVTCLDEKAKKSYAFDYVFGPNDRDTKSIYDSVGSNIVRSVMEGYNGTIFAYGQTNSGKTYTMMGTEENPGIIPIAIEEVFNYIKDTPEREFLLRVSYLEIYNESINDLLHPEGSNLTIRDDKKRGIYVEGLKEEIVVSPEHVVHVINSGEAYRHVAATDYNLTSSRSHTIFRMIIESNLVDDPSDKSVRVSGLTLIDLAGSEKVVSDSIIRRREGAYINKSLLTLGTIISRLSERKKGEKIGHLPYRDSKLTRILEPSLCGSSRIAIIATASPASSNFEETNNTLKFATRAKKVSNKTKLNQENEKLLIMKYKEEIDELKKRLDVALEAERKLQEMQQAEEAENQHNEVDELRQELQEQEAIRVSLEEKIKQLTKLILVSANIAPNTNNTTSSHSGSNSSNNSNNAASGSGKERTPLSAEARRARSISLRITNPDLIKNQKKVSTVELTPSTMEDLNQKYKEEYDAINQSNSDSARIESLEKINQALNIKIDALQQQADWRDKQLQKLRNEVKERDQKIESVLNKIQGADTETIKKLLREQFEKQIEELQDSLDDREAQLNIQRSDNALLSERVQALEQQLHTQAKPL